MLMASGFVPSQRGEEGWSISTDSLGACELSCELERASPVPRQAPLPCLSGFASDSAEPQAIEPSQGKRKLKKAVGFQLSRRLPVLRANGKAGFAFRRHSLPVGSSADVCRVWGWRLRGGGLFWLCRKEMVSPSSHPATQPNEVARWDVQGDRHRVGNLAPGLCHPKSFAHGTELQRDAPSTFPGQ